MMTAEERPFVALSRTDEERSLTLYATPARVTAVVVAWEALVLLLVFVPVASPVWALLRAAVAFLFLSLVPGYLTLRLLGIEPSEPVDTLLYTVGLSLVVVMAAGTVFNFLLRAVGVAAPLSTFPTVLSISGLVLGLAVAYRRRVPHRTARVVLDLDDVRSPVTLGLLLLPFLGIYGAILLNGWNENRLLLVLYAAIAVIPVAVAFRRFPSRLLPLAVWVISISLLLQNTLTGQYLAWGDQPKEALLAFTVLERGVWLPAFAPAFGSKFSMLRIVILHPVYQLFTDLSLFWLFRVGHPLLFSLTPVALYQTYKQFNTRRFAFLSAFLFMSLFSFFVVLSRNTRTATAIFFLALLALLLADHDLPALHRKGLAIAFAAGIVVSHYGVSYMVMLALVLVAGLVLLVGNLPARHAGGWSPVGLFTVTSGAFVLLYVTIAFGWYLYGSPEAKTFRILIGFSEHFVSALLEEFLSPAESASLNIVARDWQSSTLQTLKYYNVLIGGIIGIGLVKTAQQFYDQRISRENAEYLAFAVVFFITFLITFLPVERFNTARTYPTSLVFFAPFFILGLFAVSKVFGKVVNGDITSDRILQLGGLLLVMFFLLNSGFVSATLTHEYGPNVLVEKDRVMTAGEPEEQAYFYKQHPTEFDVTSSVWLLSNARPESVVYQSGWPGGTTLPMGRSEYASISEGVGSLERRTFSQGTQVESGYLYLNSFNVIGDVIRLPGGHFEFRWAQTSQVSSRWSGHDRLYTNGGSVVYQAT